MSISKDNENDETPQAAVDRASKRATDFSPIGPKGGCSRKEVAGAQVVCPVERP